MRYPERSAITQIAVVAGAVGSVSFMLRVGNRNGSTIPAILLVLFTGWVLSPFAALLLAGRLSKRWPVQIEAALQRVTVIIALVSLIIYGYVAWSPPRPKPASVFLLVPLGSWLLLAVAGLLLHRRLRKGAA